MADIRFNSLPTTASASSSDDFLAIDGTTNGTRKLSAYSPTFGGNLTVSGTGTSSVAGYLLVSGGGSSAYADKIFRVQNSNSTVITTTGDGRTYLGAEVGYNSIFNVRRTTGNGVTELANFSDADGLTLRLTSNSTSFKLNVLGSAGLISLGNAGISEQQVNLNTATGNLLIGTTTDSANGKLQLATHTTSAGGIGFGTDTSLYRTGSGFVQVDALSSNNPAFKLAIAGTAKAWIEYYSPDSKAYITTADNLAFRTNGGTTALTLDTSLNATFASNILLAGAKGICLGGQTNPAVQGILASGNNTNINANSSGAVNIGTASNGTLVTIDSNGVIKSQGGTAITPASASATGTAGMIQWDASYIYVCTAANTWKRVAIATW